MKGTAKRIHVFVAGRVQGVGYRYHAAIEAKKLSLFGWVRNRPDGTVEIVAEGEEKFLTIFLEWTRKGPSAARVSRVEENWADASGEFADFTIRGN